MNKVVGWFFSLQLETIKSGSPIAKPTSQSEENLLEANLYKEGKVLTLLLRRKSPHSFPTCNIIMQ